MKDDGARLSWGRGPGLGVVLFKRIMYSAVSMVFCFLGVAFAYALLNSPLAAIIQILVYSSVALL